MNPNSVDLRLDAMRAVDAILAALQATFALPTLIDGANPFRFVANDPASSKVWICDPESKTEFDRGGSRALILVDRTDYVPNNMHMNGYAGGDFDVSTEWSDIGVTTVIVTCEGGNKYQSEQLGSIVYQVLKAFRRDLTREFSLHTIIPMSVSRPAQVEQAQGSPWVTTVTIRVETQERFKVVEVANQLNAIEISRVFQTNLTKKTVDTFVLDGAS
jgi:hypothetical protein